MAAISLAAQSRLPILCAVLALVPLSCSSSGSRTAISDLVPDRLAGQIAPDYRINPGRGVVLARFSVITDGQSGFGGISNPMLVEFREMAEAGANGTPDEHPQGLTMTHPDTRVWTTPSTMPTLWKYEPPGLMAASIKPGTYDGLVIAYPDSEHPYLPESIPAASSGMAFAPLEVSGETIVYIGDIQVRQSYGFWDLMFDRVKVDYSVSDDYERTVADFRARYPQFRETPVEKRVVTVAAPAS